MKTLFAREGDRTFSPHPKFDGVEMALLVSGKDSPDASVCVLRIDPGIEIPAHIHEKEADSILVRQGAGEILVNGAWEAVAAGDHIFVPPGIEHGVRNGGKGSMELFIHHCPALL
jgi:quercetin dioxygenase-like cupin family protein